jgi:hypothetical protein
MHPLDGTYERMARAGEHLADLRDRADAICEEKRQGVVIHREPTRFQLEDGREIDGVFARADWTSEPIPVVISILIGEVIYNLRAGLDYLVYALANPGTVVVNEKTQFPIENTENAFVSRRNTFLKGVTDKHVASIERLQAFDGCDWTRTLRDLSNSDKHRHHTIVANPVHVTTAPGSTEAIIAGEVVDVEDDIAVSIFFRDRTPVIETLEQLLSEVTQVLDAFKPEF